MPGLCQPRSCSASPGSVQGRTGWPGHSPCDAQRGAGQREAKGRAGGWDLPFLMCRGLGEKGWLWSISVRAPQCPGWQECLPRAQAVLHCRIRHRKGSCSLWKGEQSFWTASLHHRQGGWQGSSASSLQLLPLCWPGIFPRVCRAVALGGLVIPRVIYCDLHAPGLNTPAEQNRSVLLLSQPGVYSIWIQLSPSWLVRSSLSGNRTTVSEEERPRSGVLENIGVF